MLHYPRSRHKHLTDLNLDVRQVLAEAFLGRDTLAYTPNLGIQFLENSTSYTIVGVLAVEDVMRTSIHTLSHETYRCMIRPRVMWLTQSPALPLVAYRDLDPTMGKGSTPQLTFGRPQPTLWALQTSMV